MAKILVCGGTGFVGSGIVRELQHHHQIRVLSRSPKISTHSNIEFVQGNILDVDSLIKAMKGCEVMINAAQFDNAPFENPSKGMTYEKIDAQGTETIVEASKKSNISRILYISGAGTGAEKTEPWFKAKWRAEKAIRNSGLNWTIFRPSWIYGPRDKSLNRMITGIRYSPVVFILGKGYRIQPVYIDDVAKVVGMAVGDPKTFGQIYELGGPEALTMKEILQTASKILNKHRLYISIPKSLAAVMFSCLEKIPGSVITRAALDFLVMDVSITEDERKKVEQDFQLRFRTLDKGLQSYI